MSQTSTNHSLYQLLLTKNEQEYAEQIYLRQPRAGVWKEYTLG